MWTHCSRCFQPGEGPSRGHLCSSPWLWNLREPRQLHPFIYCHCHCNILIRKLRQDSGYRYWLEHFIEVNQWLWFYQRLMLLSRAQHSLLPTFLWITIYDISCQHFVRPMHINFLAMYSQLQMHYPIHLSFFLEQNISEAWDSSVCSIKQSWEARDSDMRTAEQQRDSNISA